MTFFDEKDIEKVSVYLTEKGVIGATEKVLELHKITGGNMNFVMRVKTSFTTYIIKQSRPYVEKYPHVDAPVNRISIEANFYEIARDVPNLDTYMASLTLYDDEAKVMILEDLGDSADYTSMYSGDRSLDHSEIDYLIEYLHLVHTADGSEYPTNMDMRGLNHFHIFEFPFVAQNGFNLDTIIPGLQALSQPYKNDADLKERVKKLGNIYCDINYDTGVLLHGDFYPGSWLSTSTGIKVIDQEFSFVGLREFDLGVFAGHLLLSSHSSSTISYAIKQYQQTEVVDRDLVYAFAGVEVLRRIIGLAQLPLTSSIDDRSELCQQAYQWVMQWE